MVNDLCVCARLARPQTGDTPAVTSGNVLQLFTGGQVAQPADQARTSYLLFQ
jgi:hypothetical protein